jgi:3-hydroxyisobutyrate dehydrogenase-like beta-hydroxyacid dehydrogenase
MTQTVVGLIGAGRMGLPIVGHLARAGFAVIVHDVDTAKRTAVEAKGAQWAPSAAGLARSADFVLICVGYDHEVKELLAGEGGLRNVRPGTIIAIVSTINPRTVQQLAQQLQSRSIQVVDATVTGGGRAADEGTLLSFVGGDAEVVARLTPVLRSYSTNVVHCGAVGTAQVAKAVNNLIMWACLVADHEGLALARRHGVDIEALRRALLTSTATNGALENWGKQTMAWADDDMAIVTQMAKDCGIALPQAGVVRDICSTLKPRRFRLDEYGTQVT